MQNANPSALSHIDLNSNNATDYGQEQGEDARQSDYAMSYFSTSIDNQTTQVQENLDLVCLSLSSSYVQF